MKVRVKKQCYYGGRLRNADSIIEFDPAHKGKDDNGNRTLMPSWAEIVDKGIEEVEVEDPKTEFKETTLHEMAGKKVSEVRTPNIKSRAKKK